MPASRNAVKTRASVHVVLMRVARRKIINRSVRASMAMTVIRTPVARHVKVSTYKPSSNILFSIFHFDQLETLVCYCQAYCAITAAHLAHFINSNAIKAD